MTQRLLVVYLRGGADVLSLVPPYGDAGYARLRPATQVPPAQRIELDSTFALHECFEPLMPLFDGGRLAVLPGAHSGNRSRSHAQATLSGETLPDARGWTAHYVAQTPRAATGLRVMSFEPVLPRAMLATDDALAFSSYGALQQVSPELAATLAATCAGDAALGRSATLIEAASVLVRERKPAAQESTAPYPAGAFGAQLQRFAQALKADLPVEIGLTSLYGWDHHAASLAGVARSGAELCQGLAALWQDLGTHTAGLLVLVCSEFGRRVYENGSRGSDHGHGGFALLLGDNVNGGLFTQGWKGLAESQLDDGDLPATVNLFSLFHEAAYKHLRASAATCDAVFPQATGHLGLLA